MEIPNRPAPPARPAAGTPPAPPRPAPPAADRGADEVTFSPEAHAAAAGPGTPDPLRAARLKAIRESVAAGTYDTPDRLDAALDGLLADLTD